MDFGIFVPPLADSWKMVQRAEALGYSRAWFYDTQMLNTEIFVSMTAAALNTSKIRLATGVLIPSNRIAPVAASALASLNALAPGRIDFGISTGFTARRSIGLGPVKLAEMEEYIRVVRGLLAGETLEWENEAKRRQIRFLDPGIGAINIADPIPLHISAFGPKGRALTARLGAGWINSAAHVAHGKAGIEAMQETWRAAGRDTASLEASVLLSGCVLQEGETLNSPRVRRIAGPPAMIMMHSLAEREAFGDLGRPIAPPLVPIIEHYRKVYETYTPADARYLSNHRGHLMYLRPEEEPVCSAELIGMMTFTAGKTELRDRVRALRDAGYTHFGINAGFGGDGHLEQWAEVLSGV